MEIILLSVACIANSVAIVIHLVFHSRGNRRKGFGCSYADMKKAMEMQRFPDKSRKTADLLHDTVLKHYGASVDVLPGDHLTVESE